MRAKTTAREQVTRRRAQLSPAARAAAGTAAAAALEPLLMNATRVAAYAAVGAEPPTGDILARCRAAAVEVLLPLLQPDGDLDWALYSQDQPLVHRPRGLLEPPGPALGRDALASCDLVLVPALAVDRHGHRLGRGGGSYDRALPRTEAPALALLFDGELVLELPVAAHDAPVAGVVLPAWGVVHDLAAGAARSGADGFGCQ